MEEIDFTWKTPSAQQLSALRLACRSQGLPVPSGVDHHQIMMSEAMFMEMMISSGKNYSGISPYQIAELIMMSKSSLWYSLATIWQTVPPSKMSDRERSICMSACKIITDIVDSVGYDVESDTWWNTKNLPYNQDALRLVLSAFGEILRHYSQNSLEIISSGFYIFISIICDKNWTARIRKQIRQAQTYVSAKCICPECYNMVAPVGVSPQNGDYKNYRGTGACQKGHNGYHCSKCNAPHSYSTKIGVSHLTNRVG